MKKFLVVGGAVVALLGAVVLVAQAAGPGFGPWMRPAAAAGPGGVPWPAMGPGRGPWVGAGQTISADVWTAIQTATFSGVAKVLGMTPDALRQELTSKTIIAIAAAKNVSLADVQTAAADARRDAVNQAFKVGKITQDQANRLLQVGPARGFGFGPGAGPRFGFRPPFMWGPGGNFQPGPPR